MGATDFLKAKTEGRKISVVTCYDYTFARLVAKSNVDAILVGDSAGMVMYGFRSTLPVTTALMRVHTEAVVRGAPEKFVIADMPFLSFRKGIGPAMDVAGDLVAAGAGAVKLEGVDGHEEVIECLVGSGIPVMGHIGLQPQSVHAYGGFRVQGRDDDTAQTLLRQAKTLTSLGCFSIVLECIPSSLAAKITSEISISTIGIGAGTTCDGQVLVLQDMLGMNTDFRPRFARVFFDAGQQIVEALDSFDQAVKDSTFPSKEESFG